MAFLIEKLTAKFFGPWGKIRGFMFKKNYALKRATAIILVNLLGTTVPKIAHAVADFGNAAVLPVGRYQTTFRFGNVSEIQDKFTGGGILQSPSRMNQRFSNEFLMKNDEFKKFAKLLDEQLLPSQKPSKNIDLGSVEFLGGAQVSYLVPQIARGMTSNWSIGIAIPLVKYESNVYMQNAGLNTYEKEVGNGIGEEKKVNPSLKVADETFRKGGVGVMAANFKAGGYREVSDREAQFMGDIAIGSSLKVMDSRYVDIFILNQLTLPTGPKDDPDDLLDLNIFGKTEFQTVFFTNYDVLSWLELGLGLSYTWGIDDDIVKRVPTSETDVLPAASTKEKLTKNPGDSVGVQVTSMVRINSYWQTGLGYELKNKSKDQYFGDKDSRYDLLERNTDTESNIAKFKLVYTTIDGYLQGEEKIPYSVTYAFADHLAGKNVERELTHEVLMKFYF